MVCSLIFEPFQKPISQLVRLEETLRRSDPLRASRWPRELDWGQSYRCWCASAGSMDPISHTVFSKKASTNLPMSLGKSASHLTLTWPTVGFPQLRSFRWSHKEPGTILVESLCWCTQKSSTRLRVCFLSLDRKSLTAVSSNDMNSWRDALPVRVRLRLTCQNHNDLQVRVYADTLGSAMHCQYDWCKGWSSADWQSAGKKSPSQWLVGHFILTPTGSERSNM